MSARQAKFIGNLFVNTAQKTGKTYLKGVLDIDGKKVTVFGHFVTTTIKNGERAGEPAQYFAIEDTTEADALKAGDMKKTVTGSKLNFKKTTEAPF